MRPFGFLEFLWMPVQAVATGKVRGMEVSRNPLHWLSLWGWALVLVPLFVLLYPFYVVVTLVGGWLFVRAGNDARATEAGIAVWRRKQDATTYAWRDIAGMSLRFQPPGVYPQIQLTDGRSILLHLASIDEIAAACEAHAIPVDRTHRHVD